MLARQTCLYATSVNNLIYFDLPSKNIIQAASKNSLEKNAKIMAGDSARIKRNIIIF